MKSTLELTKQAGFNDAEMEILASEINRFADLVRADALEAAAQAAQDECPTPDGALCAAAIRQLKGRP
jgi:hypothetical protein